MVLMTGGSGEDVPRNDVGSLLEGAGYTNCYPPPQYEVKQSPSQGNWHPSFISKYVTRARTVSINLIDNSGICHKISGMHTFISF